MEPWLGVYYIPPQYFTNRLQSIARPPAVADPALQWLEWATKNCENEQEATPHLTATCRALSILSHVVELHHYYCRDISWLSFATSISLLIRLPVIPVLPLVLSQALETQ
jgi:hypothetical protein